MDFRLLVFGAVLALWLLSPTSGLASAGVDPNPVTNSVGMKLALIPAGEFTMGSPLDDPQREIDESPHKIRIEKPFRIGVTEVTQAQWSAVMGKHAGKFAGDQRPVESVSWKDAVAFCEKLSQIEGRKYRLPIEAEWEYACRAGSDGRYCTGDDLKELAWFDGNSDDTTHDVATRKPNAWGLYDMHGNVAEWCADSYTLSDPRPSSRLTATEGSAPSNDVQPPANPTSSGDTNRPAADSTTPPVPAIRVIRGGSFGSLARGCRCAARLGRPEGYEMKSVGFRVVLDETR